MFYLFFRLNKRECKFLPKERKSGRAVFKLFLYMSGILGDKTMGDKSNYTPYY